MTRAAPPAAWFRALTLAERRDLLRRLARPGEGPRPDSAAALVTQELWREVPGLEEETTFRGLLDAYDLTPDEFVEVTGISPADLVSPPPATAAWMALASAAYGRRTPEAGHIPELSAPESALLEPLEPLAAEGARRLEADLRQAVQSSGMASIDLDSILSEYRRVVSESFLEIAAKPLVVDMHIDSRLGRFRAGNASDRFLQYVERLRDPAAIQEFLGRYPVVLRICADHVLQLVSTIVETVRRVIGDRLVLEKHFATSGNLGSLMLLRLGLGDPHCGGRTVSLLEFTGNRKVVYKPRSLAVDTAFHEILSLVAGTSRISFERPTIVDRGSYGYMEFVEAAPCLSADEVRRFFYRHGFQLAVLYVLGGTDLHLENVVACGEHPVLVDLETLFSPPLPMPHLRPPEVLAQAGLRDSVLATGLLPYRVALDPEVQAVDISAMGGRSGQLSPLRVPVWQDVGTGDMHVERQQVPLPAASNLPRMGEEEPAVGDFASDLAAGFSAGFTGLRRRKEALLAALSRCQTLPVRVVLRSTYEYAFVLGESVHPYFVGDAIDRDRCFDQLWRTTPLPAQRKSIYRAEKADLWACDIPVFKTMAGSRNVWTSSGDEICDVFASSGIAAARRRAEHLSDPELRRQLRYVRASLSSASGSSATAWATERTRVSAAWSPMEVASAIGGHLCAQAYVDGDEATWVSVQEDGRGGCAFDLAGTDLYSGLPGIALFLLHLGRFTDGEQYRSCGGAGYNCLLRILDRRIAEPRPGAFDGLAGALYALSHIGVLLHDPRWEPMAERIVRVAAEALDEGLGSDVVAGASGVALALRANHCVRPDSRALAVARACGDLLADRVKGARAGEWHRPDSAEALFAGGFGHGPLGVAYALQTLHGATGQVRYREAALLVVKGALEGAPGLWAEAFRELQASWCRGQNGCLGALIRMFRDTRPAWLVELVDSFLKDQSLSDLLESDCSCHGEMGNLETIVDAERVRPGPRWAGTSAARLQRVLARGRDEGWACGLPVEGPGLMTGLAGIGYQLLKMAAPSELPSVLFLEPPVPACEWQRNRKPG